MNRLRRAVHFLRHSRRGGSHDEHLRAAVTLHRSGGNECAVLEAWLLTDLPLTAVAERCSVGEELVEVFEALFFNVRDRLAAKDWLLLRAVGIGPQREGTPDASWLWRWTGCMAGPVALEAMLKAVPQEWLRGGLADLPLMGPDVELEVGWPRLMALAMILPANDQRDQQFLHIAQIMRQRERIRAAKSHVSDQLSTLHECADGRLRAANYWQHGQFRH